MKQRFGLTLVFMATRSGLTRWQDISSNTENEDETSEPHFSEIHNKATDEIWYKRAVEQYFVDPESFVYAVPFDAGDDNDTLVTASHAIFHTEGSRKAPAAVVGFQFHHSALHAWFINITSTCDEKDPSCLTCASDDLDCYLLDNNGYIVVSENREHTGMFFGDIKGGIMKFLIDDNVFKKIVVFDYQAVCFRGEASDSSDSNKPYTPFHHLGWFVKWIFGRFLWLLVQSNLQWVASLASYTSDDGMYSENYEENPETPLPDPNMKQGERLITRAMINRTRPQPCDMEIGLYQLQPEKIRVPHKLGYSDCHRPYILFNLQNSNLVMVVVITLCPVPDIKINVVPIEVNSYNCSVACYKAQTSPLPRRRPKECINNHTQERDIKLCGYGTCNTPSLLVLLFFIGIMCWHVEWN